MIFEVSEKIGRLKMAKGSRKNNISNFTYKNWKQICVHLRFVFQNIAAFFFGTP